MQSSTGNFAAAAPSVTIRSAAPSLSLLSQQRLGQAILPAQCRRPFTLNAVCRSVK
eukprot:m.67492 g.67492  ORF g.67492 m.67492 type:complete len:56 (+) comp7682_c0_seq2:592-759(+)